MNKVKVFVGVVLVGIIVFTLVYYTRNPLVPKIRVGNVSFIIELALTQQEKEKGLGYREQLPEGHGMLFAYDHKEKYQFWMKGMKFPLDFVWIAERRVVDITENVPPPSGSLIPTASPKEPVSQILELNAGEVKKNGIRIGDDVVFLTK